MAWVIPGYRHIRALGSGASGQVVLAVHEATGTPVAVKYLGEQLCADRRFLDGFRAEARLLGDLTSPHVVRLWEYVEGPDGAAIVMELVDGVSLRALLRQEGATGPEAALVVLKGSLLGLGAAHLAGVVHQDYKPENVLVAADGSSKLADFGIAVSAGDSGGVVGTPPYMAPERWAGEPSSPVADVYAATVTFFECLTGSRPYSGTTHAELLAQHATAPIPDALAPEALRPLVRRGLAKDAAERPQSAAEFLAELEAVAGPAYGEDWEENGRRRLAALAALLLVFFPSAQPIPGSDTALATTVLPDPPPPGRPRRTGRLLAGAAAGVVLLLLISGYAAGVLGGHPTTVADPSPATPKAATLIGPTTAAAVTESPSPSASASASASASPSASVSATPTATPTASPDPTAAPPTGTPTAGASATPSASSPPSPPAVTVSDLQIDAFSIDPDTYDGYMAANVTTDGPDPVTVTVHWTIGSGPDNGRTVASQSITLSGKTRYLRVQFTDHSFAGQCGQYLGGFLSTSPAAANGAPSTSSYEECPIQ